MSRASVIGGEWRHVTVYNAKQLATRKIAHGLSNLIV